MISDVGHVRKVWNFDFISLALVPDFISKLHGKGSTFLLTTTKSGILLVNLKLENGNLQTNRVFKKMFVTQISQILLKSPNIKWDALYTVAQ